MLDAADETCWAALAKSCAVCELGAAPAVTGAPAAAGTDAAPAADFSPDSCAEGTSPSFKEAPQPANKTSAAAAAMADIVAGDRLGMPRGRPHRRGKSIRCFIDQHTPCTR